MILHRRSFTNLKLMNENGSRAKRATRKLQVTCSNLSEGIKNGGGFQEDGRGITYRRLQQYLTQHLETS